MRKINKDKVYKQVVDQLKLHITEHRLQPGDRLPTEVELVETLGVSRLSVREAIKTMEALGIVETRPRDGTRIRALTMAPFGEHLKFLVSADRISIGEIADVRRTLECAIMPMVVANADEGDFARLEAAIESMRQLTAQKKSIEEPDLEFHQAIAAAANNRVVEQLENLLALFFHNLVLLREFDEAIQLGAIESHERIVEALRARDAASASRHMDEHLSWLSRFHDEGESRHYVQAELLDPALS